MLYLIPQAVDRAAERAPGHPALRFSGQELDYATLADRSSRLAHALIEEGVRRGDRVGIYMGKGLNSAIAMYGIMKAGAAYVPLDPTAPVARLDFVIRNAGIRHLITEPARLRTVQRLVAAEAGLRCLIGVEPRDDLSVRAIGWAEVLEGPLAQPSNATEQDLAYVLYTSGSTGVPKGVMHTHRSGLAFAEIAAATYGFGPSDRLSNHAPLHFDLSTLDFFASAVAGATTVVIPEAHVKLPASLSKLMEDERLTVLYTVPFALLQLLQNGAVAQRDLGALRWVLFGGEPFPTKHLRALMDLLPQARFCNVYGPTETNGCTYHVVPQLPTGSDDPIPIGRPYGNVETMVVDRTDRPVPGGEVGELLIRAPSVMRGYWGRPDLDACAFYRRPVFGHLNDVFHRTGDLVRQSEDGDFLFVGRKDRQVKVRGYRIELDEVEAVLVSHPGVDGAAVFPVEGDGGIQRLQAAVIPRNGAILTVEELARHLAAHLPTYALPETITLVEEFPRTSTDKIDRHRLQIEASQDNPYSNPA